MATLPTQPPKADKWLFELHNKLWGQEHLRHSLFRTAELTSTHYRELQARLDAKHPNRHSESYCATEDVWSIKLDILLNFTPSSPPPTVDWDDDDIDVDDVDIELDEILPSEIRFLDLSSLDLKNSLGAQFPMLIRKEYDIISALLNEGPNDVTGSCVFTGIGKTAYLYMILIERLLSAKKTYFESEAGNLYAISDTVKRIFPMGLRRSFPEAKDDDCLALIDGPGTKGVFEVSSTRTRMIYTSPLQDHNHHRLALGVLGVFRAPVYLMDGWSLQELMITGIFLSPLDITFNRLQASAAYFGKSPHCFNVCISGDGLLKEKKAIKDAIKTIPSSTSLESFFTNPFDPLSLRFFNVTPRDGTRLLKACRVENKSKWIFNALMEEFDKRDETAAYRVYKFLGGSS